MTLTGRRGIPGLSAPSGSPSGISLLQQNKALDLIRWAADHTLVSGIMAEQVHPFSNAPLSVSPLTWSHATFAATILDYRKKLKEKINA
jgi:GH15 family glucan-1,4-alpha-glucosidase